MDGALPPGDPLAHHAGPSPAPSGVLATTNEASVGAVPSTWPTPTRRLRA